MFATHSTLTSLALRSTPRRTTCCLTRSGGSGYRTDEELATVFADGGVTVAGTEKFGWDRTIYTVTVAGR